ncbi:site-specific integrase [Burkholderia glumae]|nr:site-specific integrase [Burkholderia glumae]
MQGERHRAVSLSGLAVHQVAARCNRRRLRRSHALENVCWPQPLRGVVKRPRTFDRLLAYLNANVGRHRFANALRTWLLASRVTGLRPSEWEHAGLAEIGGRPCLIVKNGKATNRRANGTFRTLDLSATSTADVEAVHEILAMLEGYEREMSFGRLQAALTHYMKRATRACFGSRKTYPTLYSARHQFAADAKSSGWTQEEVAALLGHASDDTAGRHYARARSGQSSIRVAPIGPEIQTVRVKARPYAAHRRDTPNL